MDGRLPLVPNSLVLLQLFLLAPLPTRPRTAPLPPRAGDFWTRTLATCLMREVAPLIGGMAYAEEPFRTGGTALVPFSCNNSRGGLITMGEEPSERESRAKGTSLSRTWGLVRPVSSPLCSPCNWPARLGTPKPTSDPCTLATGWLHGMGMPTGMGDGWGMLRLSAARARTM